MNYLKKLVLCLFLLSSNQMNSMCTDEFCTNPEATIGTLVIATTIVLGICSTCFKKCFAECEATISYKHKDRILRIKHLLNQVLEKQQLTSGEKAQAQGILNSLNLLKIEKPLCIMVHKRPHLITDQAFKTLIEKVETDIKEHVGIDIDDFDKQQ